MLKLRVRRAMPTAVLPVRATALAAGYDLARRGRGQRARSRASRAR